MLGRTSFPAFSLSRLSPSGRCADDDVPRREPALLIKITLPRSGEISAAKFMKLSRFIVLNELAFPKRSPPDKRFPVNPTRETASRGTVCRGGGGRPPREDVLRENRPSLNLDSKFTQISFGGLHSILLSFLVFLFSVRLTFFKVTRENNDSYKRSRIFVRSRQETSLLRVTRSDGFKNPSPFRGLRSSMTQGQEVSASPR